MWCVGNRLTNALTHVNNRGPPPYYYCTTQLSIDPTPYRYFCSFHAPSNQVMPDDTCAGVCLRYKIKASTLRSINGFVGDNIQMLKVRVWCVTWRGIRSVALRVLCSCDTSSALLLSVRCKRRPFIEYVSYMLTNKYQVLRIPTSHLCRGEGIAFVPQARSRDVIVQELRHACSRGGPLGDGGLSVGEAKLYLEDADWDLTAAYAAWEADNAWEEKQLQQQQQQAKASAAARSKSAQAKAKDQSKKKQESAEETSGMPPFPAAYTAGSRSTLKKGSLKAPLSPPGAITI